VDRVRETTACLVTLGVGFILIGAPWDVQRLTLEERDVRQQCDKVVIGICITALVICICIRTPFAKDLDARVLEAVVVCMTSFGLVAHTFALPWYMAAVLGYDPEEVLPPDTFTDTGHLLVIHGALTACHLVPVRFFVIVIVDFVGLLCYVVPVLCLGGPELVNFQYHLGLLMGLTVLALLGKRALESSERRLYVSIITEKRLRFAAEFELSQLHSSEPSRRDSHGQSGGDSNPATSDAGRDLHFDSGLIAHIGEKEQWLVRREDIVVDQAQLLGEGGFGTVYACLYMGVSAAIKRPKEHLNASHMESIYNELRVLRTLNHPNIVSFYGACIDETSGTLDLVIERVKGTSLARFFKGVMPAVTLGSAADGMSETARMQILTGVSSALHYMHSRKPRVVHGDVKASNIFVEHSWSRTPFKPMLLDFGLSRCLTKHAEGLGGTLRWAAPEVFRHKAPPSTAADVFSFGRVVFYVATGVYPFSHARNKKEIQARQPPDEMGLLVGEGLAGQSRWLVEQCCSPEAAHRPAMRQALSHIMSWTQSRSGHEQGELQGEPAAAVHGCRSGSSLAPAGGSRTPPTMASASFVSMPFVRQTTPTDTVKAMVTELLFSCNMGTQEGACCFYHGALSSLIVFCEDLRRHPCKHGLPPGTLTKQCKQCGVLSHVQEPCSGDVSRPSRCFFCDADHESSSLGSFSDLFRVPEEPDL
jgi:hypothetical protein